MTDKLVLIVDDENEVAELVEKYLKRDGYRVVKAASGAEAIRKVEQHRPDLVLLDMAMPGMDGLEVMRQLRNQARYQAPFLLMSCNGDDSAVIRGLSSGADDYITKPFSPEQLVARVKAHLRRSDILGRIKEAPETMTLGRLKIDFLHRTVWVDGSPVPLSTKEYDILYHMIRMRGRALSLEELYRLTWGFDSNGDTRTLLVHISNIRKKLEPDPDNPRFIVTVRGFGYKISGFDIQASG
ncbi:response regulator transcription factor [Paenibacillus validus]|uniref:Response regulator n=1 Tax=Paenibacillus validus TaxID=44253 RepID=A0A7X2Z9L4_9BACL|nr:response regulator transcription factor [Paenibacillus validus]MUG70864.1 response regulator [Paenibacillus validus]